MSLDLDPDVELVLRIGRRPMPSHVLSRPPGVPLGRCICPERFRLEAHRPVIRCADHDHVSTGRGRRCEPHEHADQ